MPIHGSTQWTKLLLCAVFVFAIGVMPLTAQEKIKIAGKMTLTQPTRQAIDIGDTPGHQLVLAEARGMNFSTGEHKFMDSTQAVNMAFDDLAQGNGPQQGYSRLWQKADTVFIKWHGKVTTTLSAEKTQSTTFEGIWSYVKGTGQLRSIQGGGTFKGKFTSATEYMVEWEGEYSIKE